ncbi:MAG TPA: hypothetical protein VEV38_07990 [Candidatus Eremiobacteraceae bacterium]|nr:hypothetical protein [Candidatus Eremiobacteraceae bacterium]
MSVSHELSRQSRRLLQIGVLFFLFTAFEGFSIPYLASPELGLSVHRLGAFSGVFFLAWGLMWPQLNLGLTTSRVAFWLAIYSDLATVGAYMLAAVWGAGGSLIHLATSAPHGTAMQETIIQIVIYSAAPTGITAFALMLWGLRGDERAQAAYGSST